MQAKMMDAAVGLFAEIGVEATSVLEITNRAGIANGTFYNYFRDKREIVELVYNTITDALVADIVKNLDGINDARDQIALGTIWFVDAVATEPYWGRMMMNALEEPGPFRERSCRIITKYVENGLKQGHFDVECTPVLLDLFVALLAGAIRSRLERPEMEGPAIGLLAAEMQLRMLGVPAASAHETPALASRRYGDSPSGSVPQIRLRRRYGENPAA